jgi:CDP-glucose 4,6-dehydratase
VEALLERGGRLIGLVRDLPSDSRLARDGLGQRITIIRGGVEDLALMEQVLNTYEIRTVFHLAGQSIIGVANKEPVATLESNVRGTWNVLEACRRTPCVEQALVASSDKAYGPAHQLPYLETHPLAGRTPYEVSKSAADLIAQCYWHTYRLPVAIVRCANLFGGGDLNFSRIVPGTIRSGLKGEAPVIRSNGKHLRDYLYVEDAALAYLRVAEAMKADQTVPGEVFNFSYGVPLSVLELVDRILASLGRPDLTPVVLNQATNEIPEQYLSSKKAASRLGWRPTVPMDEALRRTLDWYRRYLAESVSR